MLEAPQVHFIQLKSVAVENIGILDTLEPHQHLAIVDTSCTGSDKLLAETRYRIYDKIRNTDVDTISRTSYQILNILLSHYLNATFERRFVTTWGYPNRTTGIWSGMCGDLIYRRSEIAGSMMLITQNRIFHVDYLKVPIPLKIKFVFKAPNLSTTSNIFRMPFELDVWICLLATVIIMSTVFAVVRGILMLDKKSIKSKRLEMLDAAFDVVPLATQQGSLLEPNSSAQRMLIFFGLAGLMFIEVSFSAKIISLIQAPSERIDSLRNLVESKLELGSDGQPYNQFYFSKATDPVGKGLYSKITNQNRETLNAHNFEQGVRKLQTELFAYHGYTSSMYLQISKTFNDVEKCYLRELPFFDSSVGYLSVQRNFTLREHFNVGLMRMLEVGIFPRQFNRMINDKPGCTKGTMFRPLDLIDTRFAMEIAVCGIVGALFLLLAEIALSKYGLWKTPMQDYIE
ncbi:glutamate receptor ionotropic, delta-2-like [Sabethes cyaneus]|uniref:glutamate receptor ionotropic, delta-2-like n=1 Tax=Sabethes cyaneus TaxID=53552 RepID=UPI00237D85E0|nr:glutamate receptor ionotropic, delta-2-like [Sabethes cyaneus]